MKTPKYKITANILESAGNIRKLEHDGFSREAIHKQMYKETAGASTQERRQLMKNLYQRGDC